MECIAFEFRSEKRGALTFGLIGHAVLGVWWLIFILNISDDKGKIQDAYFRTWIFLKGQCQRKGIPPVLLIQNLASTDTHQVKLHLFRPNFIRTVFCYMWFQIPLCRSRLQLFMFHVKHFQILVAHPTEVLIHVGSCSMRNRKALGGLKAKHRNSGNVPWQACYLSCLATDVLPVDACRIMQ
jgi:hypothetical protein